MHDRRWEQQEVTTRRIMNTHCGIKEVNKDRTTMHSAPFRQLVTEEVPGGGWFGTLSCTMGRMSPSISTQVICERILLILYAQMYLGYVSCRLSSLQVQVALGSVPISRQKITPHHRITWGFLILETQVNAWYCSRCIPIHCLI